MDDVNRWVSGPTQVERIYFECSFKLHDRPISRQLDATSLVFPAAPSELSSPVIINCLFQGKKVFLAKSA